MGSVLLAIVASSRKSKTSLIDLNNNLDLGECEYRAREAILLETPPLGTRHKANNFKPEPVQQSAKIGKIARITDRKIRDVKQVIFEVSHDPQLSYHKLWNFSKRPVRLYCAFKQRRNCAAFKRNSRMLLIIE